VGREGGGRWGWGRRENGGEKRRGRDKNVRKPRRVCRL